MSGQAADDWRTDWYPLEPRVPVPAEDVKHIGTLACTCNTKEIPSLGTAILEHNQPRRLTSNEDAFGCFVKRNFPDER